MCHCIRAHASRAGGEERPPRFGECGAGRRDIIDDDDVFTTDALGVCAECTAEILKARRALYGSRLRFCFAYAQERFGRQLKNISRIIFHDRARDELTLIVPAPAEALFVEGNRYEQKCFTCRDAR